jgi:hypothetical protein
MGLIFGRRKRRRRNTCDRDDYLDDQDPFFSHGASRDSGLSHGYGDEGGRYADNENWDDSPRDSWDDGWDD